MPPEPPAGPPRTIAIVGAGIVGLSCAIQLQRRGHSVSLFDPRGPGEGASFGNSGNIAIEQVLPFGRPDTLKRVPKMLLDQGGPLVVRWRHLPAFLPWLAQLLGVSTASGVDRISQGLAAILRRCNGDWKEMAGVIAATDLLVFNGRMRVYRSQSALQGMASEIARQKAAGVDVEVVTPAQIAELEPALAPGFAGGIFIRGAGHIPAPLRMSRALAAHALANGGALHSDSVTGLTPRGTGVELITAGGQKFTFDLVVIAAGAWSRRVTRLLGYSPLLDTERGYHVMLRTPLRSITRPVIVTDPGYSLVQTDDGLRLASGVEFAGLDAPPDFGRILRMAAHVSSVIPGVEPQPLSTWLGFRPSMPNSLPVIGPLPRNPNVIAAFGHGHLGVTMAPTTAKIVADLVDGRPALVPLAPYLPR